MYVSILNKELVSCTLFCFEVYSNTLFVLHTLYLTILNKTGNDKNKIYLLQVKLYEDFAKSRAKKRVEETMGDEELCEGVVGMELKKKDGKERVDTSQTHIFQVVIASVHIMNYTNSGLEFH